MFAEFNMKYFPETTQWYTNLVLISIKIWKNEELSSKNPETSRKSKLLVH